MEAAKLTVVDDEILNASFLERFIKSAKASVATIKSALSKVLGLFEANDRLVIIDKDTPAPRIPFVKLHEAGHGTMPHQSKVYSLIHDCEKTLDPEIADLFEREANVFASEALFQGELWAQHANDHKFGIKTGMALAKQFGGSNYATFRRYVTSNASACCLVVLEPKLTYDHAGFRADIRRVVVSKTFHRMYDAAGFGTAIVSGHSLASLVPRGAKQRMVAPREFVLTDRNGDTRTCTGEAFKTPHQILVLVRDEHPKAKLVALPGETEFNTILSASTRKQIS
ncbi:MULTISPECIES: ImmA/IrrE family metallo-endopeptidase [Bradyrhizobium]|uniref:IrrE N-terminal-like domain-containing protein n=2 Tax=Bradyrhizobium TaxID=374 RepID=A0ABY0PYY9_9BRAD|nr:MULTISPECIES: hypothetical protein [Bradyrhizobium]SDJ18467.1 hypothetical protein SAMN05444163_4776 [Bradyrhizobium ottawaense]SEC84092.1 hypothetical protein SAMN05444171_2387 [Bradyrhizobium lablabi]